MSSVGFPQSNDRAQVKVNTAKRLLILNTGPRGSLHHDHFLRAMLQLRNTPHPGCNLSFTRILFGRLLCDKLFFCQSTGEFSNPPSGARDGWRRRRPSGKGSLIPATPPVSHCERVFLQNQLGRRPTKWDRSEVVVESPSHD